jgi:hypothetical protein
MMLLGLISPKRMRITELDRPVLTVCRHGDPSGDEASTFRIIL